MSVEIRKTCYTIHQVGYRNTKSGGRGGKGWMKNGVSISNADYLYRVLKSGRLAIPYNRLVIEILRVEGGEGRGWMKDVVVHI